MFGNLKVGNPIRQTHIRFRNNSDYEAYINAIDQDYDSEGALSMVIFIKSTLLTLLKSIDLKTERAVVRV